MASCVHTTGSMVSLPAQATPFSLKLFATHGALMGMMMMVSAVPKPLYTCLQQNRWIITLKNVVHLFLQESAHTCVSHNFVVVVRL